MQRVLLVLFVILAMIIVAGTFITNQQNLEAGGLGPALPTAASPYCKMSNSDFFNEMGIEKCP
jgi:hypothetical protein